MAEAGRWMRAWGVALGITALMIPVLAGYVLVRQAQTPMLGCYVNDVEPPDIALILPGSAAETGGLQVGDLIRSADGKSYAAFRTSPMHVGQVYRFRIERAGQALTVDLAMGTMLQGNRANAAAGILLAVIFWGSGLYLLRRGWPELPVRLLFLFFQSCAVAVLSGLAYPRFRLPDAWFLALAMVGLTFAGPLLVHFHLSFPVRLGSAVQRRWLPAVLYLPALAAAADAARRPSPWQSPALWFVIAMGALALAVSTFVYFRKAEAGARRRMRVVAAGTVLGLGPPLAAYLVPTALAGYTPDVPRWLVSLFVAPVPLSYLYAGVRHNLFTTDRLLNRAMVYTILTLGIFSLYVGPLLLVTSLRPDAWLPPALVAAVLALPVALGIPAARGRVQRWTDRLFYGGWYDYAGVVERTSITLTRCQQWEEVAAILTADVPDQMHLAGAALALGGRKTRPLRPDARPRLELPLHCGERGDGIWTIGPRLDGDDFHPEDRRILATLAREAEIALCNVLLLEALREQLDEIRGSRATLVRLQRQLLRTREAERGRLARDLHDGPIQTLVGMNLQLGLLAPAVSGAGEGPPAGEKLLELRASVRVLLAELRQVCKTLRPPMLDTLGLGAALRALVEDWAEQRGVAVRLNLAPDADLRRLPEEVAVNLYRVVQEALSNVARHAQARRVDLHLTADPASGCLELAIQDDGCGFIPATLAELTDRGHFGLAGIRERVDLIGGHWLLDSAPGRGTTLRVIWTPPPGPSGTAVPVLFPES